MTLSHNSAGVMPVIEVRRGMPGVMLGGLWTPLPIRGGDGTGEGDGSENPPANGGTSNNPPASKPDDRDDESKYSEQARLTLAKIRAELKEAKAQGKAAETLRAKLKEIEDAQLSEAEKIAKERDELKASLTAAEQKTRDRIIRSEVRVAASELGFADPEDAWRFIERDAIEFDDDGEPTNVKKLLEVLLQAKAYLKGAAAEGKAGVPPTPKPNGKASRDDLVKDKMEKLKTSGGYTRL